MNGCDCGTCKAAHAKPAISHCPNCRKGEGLTLLRCEKRGLGEYGPPTYAGSVCLRCKAVSK